MYVELCTYGGGSCMGGRVPRYIKRQVIWWWNCIGGWMSTYIHRTCGWSCMAGSWCGMWWAHSSHKSMWWASWGATWHITGMQSWGCLTKQAWAMAEFVEIDSHCACRCALVIMYANHSRMACWCISRGGISIHPSATYLMGLPLTRPPLGCFNPSTPPLP